MVDTSTLKKKNTVTSYIRYSLTLLLVFLAVQLLSQNFGYIDLLFSRLLAVLILFSLFLLNVSFRDWYIYFKKKSLPTFFSIGIVALLLSFLLLLFTNSQLIWLASIPLFLCGMCRLGKLSKDVRLLSYTTLLYALFFFLITSVPLLWYLFQQFSLGISHIIGQLMGTSLSLGPSASGLWIVVLFVIYAKIHFLTQATRSKTYWRSALSYGFSLFLLWIVYQLVLAVTSFSSKTDTPQYHWILFVCLLIPTLVFTFITERKERILPTISFKKIYKTGMFWASIFLFCASILFVTPLGYTTSETNESHILFYAQDMLGTWDSPTYGTYGRDAVGMFGLLPVYLSSSGYNVELLVKNTTGFLASIQPENASIPVFLNLTDYVTLTEASQLSADHLQDVDIVVLININTSLSSLEKTDLWTFVQQGGSLLVLGDHTNVGGIQDPLNDVLEPVDISFHFDSALPLDSLFQWDTCYQFPYHPITTQIRSNDEIQISVGASLDISPICFPLIIGRYGLSDNGDRANEDLAYLGDYEYGSGEQLGDIVLAAGSSYGEGHVLVFGDTSSFQNSALPYSYSFVYHIFSWFDTAASAGITLLQQILGIVSLVAAGLLVFFNRKTRISFILFSLALVGGLLISSGFNAVLLEDMTITGNVIYLDASHQEQFSLTPFTDESLNGLILNLNRNGYLVLFSRTFDTESYQQSKMLVFTAPTSSFSSEEITFLQQYMSKGGYVLLASGFEDKSASLPLLQKFACDIENVPLGPVPYGEEDPELYENEPRFVDAWPLTYPEDQAISFYNFTWAETYHLIVFFPYGSGGLLVIGDSDYLLDANTESIYDYWPGNILFLKHLLDELELQGDLP